MNVATCYFTPTSKVGCDLIHFLCHIPKTHQSCEVSWSLLQLQPAHALSVQFDTAKCDRAVAANTRAAGQAGDGVSETM